MNTILIVAFVVMGLLLPTLFCAGFFYGFCTAKDVFCRQSVSKYNIPGNDAVQAVKNAVSDAAYKETDEQRQARILAKNVENFGTGIPQQEVE